MVRKLKPKVCLSHCAYNSKNNSMSPKIHNHMSVTHPICGYVCISVLVPII